MNRRHYSDEEREAKKRESANRVRAMLREGRKIKHELTTSAGIIESPALMAHYRRLRRSANMCEIKARLWLIDRGYSTHGSFSHKAMHFKPKQRDGGKS